MLQKLVAFTSDFFPLSDEYKTGDDLKNAVICLQQLDDRKLEMAYEERLKNTCGLVSDERFFLEKRNKQFPLRMGSMVSSPHNVRAGIMMRKMPYG